MDHFFTRRWILTTLLVLIACGVMVRLGIWQLDRLKARRAFNARVAAQQAAPTLELAGAALEADLPGMEYRRVSVTGEYLHEDQVALRNRVWGNRPGVHLITPLRISGTNQAILVDRGWIPAEAMDPAAWPAYDEAGVVTVQGLIRRSTTKPDVGRRDDPIRAPGEGPLKVWNLLNVERIDQQMQSDLLPVYVQQAPNPAQAGPPYRSLPDLELTDGPHLGYAGQWFLFALILGIGYPFYLRRQSREAQQADQPYVSSESISN